MNKSDLNPISWQGMLIATLALFLFFPLTGHTQEGTAPKSGGKLSAGVTFLDCPDCPAMVVVPAGRFTMGDVAGAGDPSALPLRTVAIDKPFAIGKYEVTQAEWITLMGGNPSAFKATRHPVERVNWEDVQKFLFRLSAKTGQPYRLPTEAEWEYAARGGTESHYHTGPRISTSQANYDGTLTYNGNEKGLFREGTSPVGSFPPNDFGLYDVHGNVWEWVDDCWNPSYEGAPLNADAWTRGECTLRVLRGGSWISPPKDIQSATRGWAQTRKRIAVYGFRLARDLD